MEKISIDSDSDSACSLEAGVENDTIEEFDGKAVEYGGDDEFHVWHEMKLLLEIAAPAVVVQFSVLFIFPQTASAVGLTLGTKALAGFSLGSLVGNLTCLSVMAGTLMAADILMPRAWGAKKYEEMGILAIRSVIICGCFLLIPFYPLLTCMEMIFDKLGQDREASHLASQWIRVYLIGVPSVLLFRVAQSFLNSQKHVYPMVFASVVASYFVHPKLLKLLVPTMGENGSALAISLTQWVMICLVFLYLRFKPEKPETRPRISFATISEALKPQPMLEFISLSLGGIITLSEWWLWETICFIVGTFGVVPLVVHSIAYNLVPLLFMPTLGMQMGLTVRMGHIIAYDIVRAKLLATWCMIFTVIFGAILSISLYIFRIEIALLFTDDMDVVEGCKEIWGHLSCYIFILHIFGINSAILRVLGLQWRMAIIIFGYLWFVVLPTIIYFAVYEGNGLKAVWTILPILYSILQMLLIQSYITVDWKAIGREIYDREHGEESQKVQLTSDESMNLLSSSDVDNSGEDK